MSRVTVVLVVFFSMHTFASAGDQQPSGAVGTPGTFGLTLAEARRQALSASPELQALTAALRAAEGAAQQARAVPNPDLTLEVEDLGTNESFAETAQTTLSLSQTIEWVGKRTARVGAARLGAEVAACDVARGRRNLLAEVDRAFALMLGAQTRAAIAEENAETARELARAVSSLVAAGEVSPIEEARAQSDEALAALDRDNARRDVDLARLKLARLWGEGPGSPFTAAGTLAPSATLPDRDAALAGLSSLPDVTRWEAESARHATLETLARKQALPDITLSVGARSYSGLPGHGYVAGVSLPVPLATRFAGARAEASARQEQARHDRRAEEARIRAEFLAAHDALSRAIDEARALGDEVLPKATRIYEALNEGYRRGKFGLLDVLEARRALAHARLRYVDALVRLNVADADLRRLMPDAETDDDGAQP